MTSLKNVSLQVLSRGKRIFIDDGLISVVILEVGDDYVLGEVENGGSLGSRKGCNLPGTDTDLVHISNLFVAVIMLNRLASQTLRMTKSSQIKYKM